MQADALLVEDVSRKSGNESNVFLCLHCWRFSTWFLPYPRLVFLTVDNNNSVHITRLVHLESL